MADKGILHDREWMFADEKGKFITQRRYHKLALVHPKLVPSVEYPTVRSIDEGVDVYSADS